MPVTPSFHFPLAVLSQEGDAILDAAEAHATELAARLPASRTAEIRALHQQVSESSTGQKGKAAEVGTLTQQQNASLTELNRLLSNCRDTAKRAFKGQDVKLHDEFQVGINKPVDLASVLARARITLAACQNADNAAALTGKGWIASDTQALSDAIAKLDTTDDTQETAKATKKGATADVMTAANALYNGLLDIQNIANIQYPANNPANIKVRAEFRLDTFPPKQDTKKKSATSDKPVTPQPPAPNP
jgi:hypothetical protein